MATTEPDSTTAPAAEPAAALVARPFVDIPISIGRLRVLRGFQVLCIQAAGAVIFAGQKQERIGIGI
jgi:hypothetical protein